MDSRKPKITAGLDLSREKLWNQHTHTHTLSHDSKSSLNTVKQLHIHDGHGQTDLEVCWQYHHRRPFGSWFKAKKKLSGSTIRQTHPHSCFHTKTEPVIKMETAAGSPGAFTGGVCVCFKVSKAGPYVYKRHSKKKSYIFSFSPLLHQIRNSEKIKGNQSGRSEMRSKELSMFDDQRERWLRTVLDQQPKILDQSKMQLAGGNIKLS